MSVERRVSAAARILLTIGALLPYWRLLTLAVVYVPDDYAFSDVFDGELPARVIAGNLVSHGHWPVWTAKICSGYPLSVGPADPLGVLLFSAFRPAPALDLLVIVLLLVAAHGAYGLARRFGADPIGAVLAGLAFAGSGYIACQLRHLSITSTVVWLPVGMLLIDRAITADRPPRRMLEIAGLGIVYANQVLAGFPQSAYICGLAYGSFAVFRIALDRRRLGNVRSCATLFGAIVVTLALGAIAGAVVLLPLSELGSVSDRVSSLGYTWATYISYWPPNVLTFLFPYINGDFGNATYIGTPLFWEDYAYVGAAPFLLALFAAFRERRRPMVRFAAGMTAVAFLLAVGRRTPIFHIAYVVLPGMNLFRFPTRFLVVVDLGIAVLGGIGLTWVRARLERAWRPHSRAPQVIVAAVCVLTVIDLCVHQPRQDPMVPSAEWLAPPPAATAILNSSTAPRSFSPRHRDVHRQAELAAHGWADVRPFYDIRELIEPNTGGGYWNIPSADCYVGIAPRWHVDVWSDHSRESGLVTPLAYPDFDRRALVTAPAFANVMRTYGVTHVLSPFPANDPSLTLLAREPHVYAYTVPDGARARFVASARPVANEAEAAARLVDPSFDPSREVLLLDAPASVTAPDHSNTTGEPVSGTAAIARDDDDEIDIDVDARGRGFLVLADTYYPGWHAEIDGTPTPIYRADISVRAVAVPSGRHRVRFGFSADRYFAGLKISLAAVGILLLWAVFAHIAVRRYS
jgi:hypothetical protein